MSLLTVDQLSVSSKRSSIVNSVSFTLQPAEWLTVVGQSGSGKSMTALALGGLLEPGLKPTGRVEFGGVNLLTISKREMKKQRGTGLSYVFQDYQNSFSPFQTISRHFDELLRIHTPLHKSERRTRTADAMESVGLPAALADRYSFQLSGGQLQRVSIALALLLNPALLIADEPTTALDSLTAHRILELLAKLREQTNCAILFITHDLRHAAKYADRIAVMHEGTLVEIGDKSRVLSRPEHHYTQRLIQAAPILNRPEEGAVQ